MVQPRAPDQALICSSSEIVSEERITFKPAATNYNGSNSMRMLARNVLAAVSLPLMTATAAVLLLLGVSAGRAQITNFEPGMLAKQRSALYTKATRAPLADLESDVNH